MAGEEEKEGQFPGWMQEKPQEAKPEESEAPTPPPASEEPTTPAAAPAPAAVPEEEPRMLAPAARPPRPLRGAFLALIGLAALGIALIVLTYYGKLDRLIAVGVFTVLMGAVVGGIAGILLGDLVVQPSALSRFIAIAVAVLIGYLSSAIVEIVRAGKVKPLVEDLTTFLNSNDIFIVWLILLIAVFALVFGFLLGFLYAARPRD